MLVCFLFSLNSLFQKLLNGKSGLVCMNLSFLGEPSHIFTHILFILTLYSCFDADELIGRGDLSRCGRSACLLAWPFAASFANLSAASFPLTSLWLEIHLTVSLHGSSFTAVITELIKYCPEGLPTNQEGRGRNGALPPICIVAYLANGTPFYKSSLYLDQNALLMSWISQKNPSLLPLA